MKLETKLGLSTGGLIVAMLVSAGSANVRMQESNRVSTRVISERTPLIFAAKSLRVHSLGSVSQIQSYMLFGLNDETAARYRSERARLMVEARSNIQTMLALQHTLDTGEDAVRVAKLSDELTELQTLEEKVEQLNGTKTADNVAAAYVLLQHDVLQLINAMFATIDEITISQKAASAAEVVELQHANQMSVLTLWITTLLGAILGGFIQTILVRRVTRAIGLLVERADSIAAGDLTGDELVLQNNDQVGMLAAAMNAMQTALGGIIGTVASTAGSLTGSAVSMRSASDHIHRRIDQQSQQTQQAATAMQEMSASIAEVSRHTQSAAETARSAAETAREGGQIVKQVLDTMHSIASAVTDTSATVGLLGEDSKRISQIVTVIDEIARKTNLLALNASIEAARAGDHGRGFAVVAGEVRRLAESTAQATGEIGTMIQEIQDRTRTAIASMKSGTGTVEEGVVTTTQAGEALERIIGMAERVDRMIAQIAIAASQQAAAADQSSASLDSIHTLSHENLTEMATTAAGIESLRGTAVTLERQVDRFHVSQLRTA